MAQLDEKNEHNAEESPVDNKTMTEGLSVDSPPKNKSLVDLQHSSGVSSETSSITGDGSEDAAATLSGSTLELKRKTPRKLIEDERRATGRISWDVWRTYLVVSAYYFDRHRP